MDSIRPAWHTFIGGLLIAALAVNFHDGDYWRAGLDALVAFPNLTFAERCRRT